MNLLRLLNANVASIKLFILVTSSVPAVILFYQFTNNQLGINGLEKLLKSTGYTAFLIFILTLAITPLRRIFSYASLVAHHNYGKRLGDWNWMIKIRRLLGVMSFLYALLHFFLFFYFELDLEITELKYEVEERPFILAGLLAILLLTPLFLTSTDASMRRLKKNWRRLHRLVYPIALLITLHYLWLTKPGVYDAYPYAAIVIFLLLFRVLDHFKVILKRKDDGMLSER